MKKRTVKSVFCLQFAYFERSYARTYFFEDGTRGAAATRKGAPSTRREYEVAGAL